MLDVRVKSLTTSAVTTLLTLFAMLLPAATVAQNLLNLPESAVFDTLFNRYLVSNWGTGTIVQIDSNGVQSNFVGPEGCQAGLEIVGEAVYVGCSALGIKGYDLHTGMRIMHVIVPGAILLNDVTSDTSGNIYVTDVDAHEIIKVRLSDHSYSTFVSSDLYKPNGILFDETNNRLLVASTRTNSPIQAVSLEDSTVTTVATTSLDDLDGLTVDNNGNYYVSSWGTRAVYMFRGGFTDPAIWIYQNSGGPADLYFNRTNDTLVLPLMFANTIRRLPGQDFQDPDDDGVLNKDDNCPNDYNPSQSDLDFDDIGDTCDNCINEVNPDQANGDADTLGDACDNCPTVDNADQNDYNDDGIGDACCCGHFTGSHSGNANCSADGKLTLSDISRMIDYVYISKEPLCCAATGNANGSEDCKVTLSDITRLIDAVYISKQPPEGCLSTCMQ
jgi:sugar lactone lactonase YvrE